MDRLDWMYVRALVPSGLALGVACFLSLVLQQAGTSPFRVALAGFAPWVFLVGVAVALGLAFGPIYRLWQWERGAGLICPNCSGPLGGLIAGRYGPYYKCLCCSGNIAARRVQ